MTPPPVSVSASLLPAHDPGVELLLQLLLEELHEGVFPAEAVATLRRDDELHDVRGAVEAHMPSVETVDDVGDLAVDLRLLSCWDLQGDPQVVLVEYGSLDLDPSEAFDVNACFGHDSSFHGRIRTREVYHVNECIAIFMIGLYNMVS